MPPPVPVTVIVYVPVAVVEETTRFKTDVPEPVTDVGLKLAVTPVGWPLAERVTAESKPSTAVTAIVEVPLLPCATETDVGDADRVKVGVVDVGASALIRP